MLSELKKPSLFTYIHRAVFRGKERSCSNVKPTNMSLSNVTPNVVCNMCSSALSTAKEQYDILMKMYRSCDGSEMIIHNKIAEKEIRQHSNFAELERAADAGCHLCNLIKLFSRGVVGIKEDVPVCLKFEAVQAWNFSKPRPLFDIVIGDEFTEIHLGVNGMHILVSSHDKTMLIWPKAQYSSNVLKLNTQIAQAYYSLSGKVPTETFKMLDHWLQQCQWHHRDCNRKTTLKLPTRLINVGTDPSGVVHLINTDEKTAGPYTTLSHCWGRINHLPRTTRQNIEEHMQGIHLEILPQTFKDAVLVTRELGLKYLWIDSLCIIQGDKDDWDAESSRMAETYENGLLNLAASYSSDSNGGLMLERNGLQVTPLNWNHEVEPITSKNHDGRWMESGTITWTYGSLQQFATTGLERRPTLSTRGWVLQESVLSPRTAHFLPGQVIWECCEAIATEPDYIAKGATIKGSIHTTDDSETSKFHLQGSISGRTVVTPFLETLKRFPLDCRTDKHVETGSFTSSDPISFNSFQKSLTPNVALYKQWYDVVTEYSQRSLTYSEDRLPAIWALAQRFQSLSGDMYCGGLWRKDLLTGLLFENGVSQSLFNSADTYAPTWSWAATDGKVDFFYARAAQLPKPFNEGDDDQEHPYPDAIIDEVSLEPTGPLSMGRTKHARLTVSTFTISKVCKRRDWNPHPDDLLSQKLFGRRSGLDSVELWRIADQIDREMLQRHSFNRAHRSNNVDPWTKQRALELALASQFHSTRTRTDCYFNWSGRRFQEQDEWKIRNEESRKAGEDKILKSGRFRMVFDTQVLANRYVGEPVTCLHIRGNAGLLIEHSDSASIEYRRIGVYEGAGHADSEQWEQQTVTLV